MIRSLRIFAAGILVGWSVVPLLAELRELRAFAAAISLTEGSDNGT